MQNFHNIIIIGAGPIGLYFASKCESSGLDYLLLEGGDSVGGQLTRLYPEKEIVDIPEISSIKSKDYITLLNSKIDNSKVSLFEQVIDISPGEIVKIKTIKNEYACKYLIIATGLGTTTPRPLGVENEEKVDNIIYAVNDYSFLKNKKVAIFGGGDSALDWAKHISAISNDVHLVHRRTEFRGNPETIKDCKTLNIHLPYIPSSIEIQNGKAIAVKIQKVESEEYITIPVDYIFVNYGNIAKQTEFKFPMKGAFLSVNTNNEVAKNIFAIGDVADYENKTRRIAPGLKEADKVFKLIND